MSRSSPVFLDTDTDSWGCPFTTAPRQGSLSLSSPQGLRILAAATQGCIDVPQRADVPAGATVASVMAAYRAEAARAAAAWAAALAAYDWTPNVQEQDGAFLWTPYFGDPGRWIRLTPRPDGRWVMEWSLNPGVAGGSILMGGILDGMALAAPRPAIQVPTPRRLRGVG